MSKVPLERPQSMAERDFLCTDTPGAREGTRPRPDLQGYLAHKKHPPGKDLTGLHEHTIQGRTP